MHRIRTVKTSSGATAIQVVRYVNRKTVVNSSLIPLAKCRNLGFRYQLLYETLDNLANLFKFHLLPNRQIKLLTDLVLTRIVSPSSKLESLKFLKRYFNASH